MRFPLSIGWKLVRRSAELAGIAGIDGGTVAVLEAFDLAATGEGDAVACFPFGGWRRRGRNLFLSELESEQFWLVLHLYYPLVMVKYCLRCMPWCMAIQY